MLRKKKKTFTQSFALLEYIQAMSDMTTQTSNLVTLNVGGTRFTTTTETLLGPDTTESIFVPLLSGGFAKEDEIFFDRNPIKFAFILEYLRTGKLGSLPANCSWSCLAEEAKYFGLTKLQTLITEMEHVSDQGKEQTFEFQVRAPNNCRGGILAARAYRIGKIVVIELGKVVFQTFGSTELIQIVPSASFLQSPFVPSRDNTTVELHQSKLTANAADHVETSINLVWSMNDQHWIVQGASCPPAYFKRGFSISGWASFKIEHETRCVYLTDAPMTTLKQAE